jgi:type IV fimbrial biogenesis protein FimT
MSEMSSKHRDSGFTMMELIMTMAIVAILASIAIPSFKYVTNSNRIASEVNGLLGDMQFARSEAVKQGQTVTVCTSTDGATCAGATVNTWHIGWIVFLDPNGNHVVDAGEKVLRVQPAFTGGDTFVATPSYAYATFNRMGYAPTGSASIINISLKDSTSNTQWTRCLAINPIGSVLTEKHGEQKFGTGTTACP